MLKFRTFWATVLAVTACFVGILVSVCIGTEEPTKGIWWYFPVALGTPKEPVPPKQELLKVVPPLREVPVFSKEAKDLGLAIWWADYSQILYSEQPPSNADLNGEPVIATPSGEDEPLVLGLWGITYSGNVTLGVNKSLFPVTIRRVEFDPRRLPTPYRGVDVPGGRLVGFSTYLPESNTGTVKPGENTVFWINVEIPEGTKPGSYPILLDLTIQQVKVITIKAIVKVLPFKLPRADIAYGMYFRWAGPKGQTRYNTPNLMRAYWRDMARHGMTSISFYQYTSSGDFMDTQGNIKPLDSHLAVQQMQEMKQLGLIYPDIPIMLLSTSLRSYPEVARIIRDEFRDRGLPELLLYGRDEPEVNDETRAAFETLRPVRKYMRVITAISDEAAAAYADLIDVWVVNAGRLTPDIHRLAAQKNKELWTYDYTHRGHGNSTRARFYAGLYTWALKLKGNFQWCYTEGYSWEGNRNSIRNFVLPSDKGPIPSVSWEARREGVEDYRTLKLLEACITNYSESPVAKEAEKWLEKIRSRVDWDLIKGMPKSVYPWDGAEVFPMCPRFEPEELPEIRATAQDYIIKLNKLNQKLHRR